MMRNRLITVSSLCFILSSTLASLCINGCSDETPTNNVGKVYVDTLNAFPVDLLDMGEANEGCGKVLRHYRAYPDTATVVYYLLETVPDLLLQEPNDIYGATLLVTRDSVSCTNARDVDSLGQPVRVSMKCAQILLLIRI
jgi:hypothetical protein